MTREPWPGEPGFVVNAGQYFSRDHDVIMGWYPHHELQLRRPARRGLTGPRAAPFGDLDDDGSAALMDALGETGPTTQDNHAHRVRLVTAYREALQGES